jgi:hypothetical protein
MNDQISPVSARAIAIIDRRLEDLAEANALYGKDQRLSVPDKIARNEREISWLKDLRSELVMSGHAPTPEVTDEMIIAYVKAADGFGVEKGSFLWDVTKRGLEAALSFSLTEGNNK